MIHFDSRSCQPAILPAQAAMCYSDWQLRFGNYRFFDLLPSGPKALFSNSAICFSKSGFSTRVSRFYATAITYLRAVN